MIISDFTPKTLGSQQVSAEWQRTAKNRTAGTSVFRKCIGGCSCYWWQARFTLLSSCPIKKDGAMEGVFEASSTDGVLYADEDRADEVVFRLAGKNLLSMHAKQTANTATMQCMGHCFARRSLPDELHGRLSEVSNEAGVG